jgi:hypothetical protein
MSPNNGVEFSHQYGSTHRVSDQASQERTQLFRSIRMSPDSVELPDDGMRLYV